MEIKIKKIDLLRAIQESLKNGTEKEKKEIKEWMNHAFDDIESDET